MIILIEVWTDGSSRPQKISNKKYNKKGPSSAALIIKDGSSILFKDSKYLGDLDGNQAEYEAFIWGLETIISMNKNGVIFYTDSNLIEKQMNFKYNCYSEIITPYYLRAKDLISKLLDFKIVWVPRKLNIEADKLTKYELDKLKGN